MSSGRPGLSSTLRSVTSVLATRAHYPLKALTDGAVYLRLRSGDRDLLEPPLAEDLPVGPVADEQLERRQHGLVETVLRQCEAVWVHRVGSTHQLEQTAALLDLVGGDW